MLRNYRIQAGSRPATQSPSRGASSDTRAPMLSATPSNNHSLFSFGRSNGSSASAASKSTSTSHRADHDERRSSYNDESDAASASASAATDDDNTSDVANHHTASFDFLPSVSFDDLQSSLESASTEFRLAQFPSPSGQGTILPSTKPIVAMDARPDNSYGEQSDNTDFSTPKRAPVATTAATAAAAAASATLSGAAPATARTSAATSTTDGRPVRKAASILRRPSVSTRTNNSNSNGSLPTSASSGAALDASSVSSSVPGATGPTRQRRQSHYPPVSNSHIAKPPRKSVGPGLFDPDYMGVGRTASRRRPSVASDSDPAVPASARSSIDGGSRIGSGGGDGARGSSSSRATKARSFQPPSSRASVSSTGADQAKPSSRSTAHRLPRGTSHSSSYGNFNFSTGQANSNSNNNSAGGGGKGAGGPGFSTGGGKRMSMAPVLHASQHATGLGARTISPTDTRRMKRRSIMPNGTSADSTNTPTKAVNANAASSHAAGSRDSVAPVLAAPLPSAAEIRASSRSPSMLPRKTSTPSSSRTTPDPNRKSYSSGFSAGSSLSFYTVRSSTGSIQPRMPQGAGAVSGTGTTGSRLPAPKAMGMPSAAPSMDDDEDVPPVPAIPKAYESPKEPPVDLTFFEKRKSNLALDTSSTHSSSTASLTGSGHPTSALEPAAKVQRKPSTRATRDFSRPTHAVAGEGTPSGQAKKNLQPLRLPPMNLTPLNASTTAKIAAFQAQGVATMSSDRNMSPPPSRVIAKTPTTPMTASKSSFFSRHRNDDRADLPTTVRSSSSVHHHARSESATAGGDEYPFAAAPSRKTPSHKSSVSPFLSTPKGSATTDVSYMKSRTPSGTVAGEEGFLPAPPPIPPSASSTLRKPSGPRAPAPTPSRAFAPIETASGIVAANDAMRVGSDATAPGSSFAGLAPKSPPPVANTDDPPTPSSIGSSLRRKLSLSWKRNNSKSSLGGSLDKQAEAASTESKPHLFSHHRHASSQDKDKHDGMPPPPRIPKSVTASQLPATKPSANQTPTTLPRTVGKSSGSYLEARRRKSSASSLNAILTNEKTGDPDRKKDMISTSMPQTADVTMNGAHLQALQQHKLMRAKSSAASVHPHPHLHPQRGDVWSMDLDKDDLVAEEEMRKLGGRRKETELAARTLDALRQRATAKGRVSPQEAARIAMLNLYERGEIVDFNDIYFCGTQNAAKVVGSQNADRPNFGYDDERGDYTIVAGDHLAYRYEIIDLLGKGSFGQVVRCIDHKAGTLVAVKIIRNKKRFHQQALVEVNILRKLREWDPQQKHSMVNFTDSFYFRGHLCISTELLDMNLYEFIKANSFRGFSLKLIRRFTKQILSSLNLLKQHKVIHCDLKPENILLRHPMFSEIKVIDFGSSCFENEKVYTYIQSRFYRSPEVILGMTYGMPIDMWSLGCILAELYTGVPIFPGENEQEQLACIMEVFGPPEKHLIEKSTRKKLFFDSNGKPRLTVPSKGRRRRPSSKTLQQAIKCDDEAFLDFLARCLRWDPERRLKPDEAIRHEFITGQKSILPPRGSHHHHSGSTRDGSPIRRHHTVSTSNAGAGAAATSGGGPRPLPEPPGGSSGSSGQLKLGSGPTLRAVGTGGTPRESLGAPRSTAMASTAASSRRASAVAGSAMSAGGAGGTGGGSLSKRTSAGGAGAAGTGGVNASNSNLPRASGRVVSGGGLGSSGGGVTRQSSSDLAAAGAAAAMTRRGA